MGPIEVPWRRELNTSNDQAPSQGTKGARRALHAAVTLGSTPGASRTPPPPPAGARPSLRRYRPRSPRAAASWSRNDA